MRYMNINGLGLILTIGLRNNQTMIIIFSIDLCPKMVVNFFHYDVFCVSVSSPIRSLSHEALSRPTHKRTLY